jgi:hypothetical protein
MMDEDFALFEQQMRSAMTNADPVERLRQSGRAYARFALAHPHHYRLMFMTTAPNIDPSDSTVEHGNPDEDGYACLRATVADCIAQGRFLPAYRDIEKVTQSCWACAHGLVSLYITHGKAKWVRFADPLATAFASLDMHIDGLTGFQNAQAAVVSHATSRSLQGGRT